VDLLMRDHLFAVAFIALTVLGLSQAALEWMFWRGLSVADAGQVQQVLGVAVNDRRLIGAARFWRFLLKREYTRIARAPVLLGDFLLVVNIAFAVALLGIIAAFVFRFVGLWLHNEHH